MSKSKGKSGAKAKDVKQAKAKELSEKLIGMQLLGEIITWNAKSEDVHKHKDVVAALEHATLETKIARELLPRHAFSRACKKLSDEAVIDVVKEGQDEIRFQFTKKMMHNDEWKYSKETELLLNKTTGVIECPKSELKATAQRLLDEALEVRTTSDITKIVQRLFEKNGELFPIRDQGGVYFVPQEHTEFIAKIELFLGKLGGHVTRFPVPAGTQFGDKAVQDTVAEAMMQIVREHNDAVSQFTINTRKDTIEHAAEKIKATRIKVEAYANYLQDRSAELLKEVDAANEKLMAQVNQLSEAKANAPEGTGGLFGHSVTAVIRWMGQEGWSFKEVRTCLEKKNLQIAEATIRAQLLAGRNGTRGEPAKLDKKQQTELESLKA